jgi:hypothetical protein
MLLTRLSGHTFSASRRQIAMKTRVTLIVIITLLLMLFLSLSHSDLAMEIRTFLRALLRAMF